MKPTGETARTGNNSQQAERAGRQRWPIFTQVLNTTPAAKKPQTQVSCLALEPTPITMALSCYVW